MAGGIFGSGGGAAIKGSSIHQQILLQAQYSQSVKSLLGYDLGKVESKVVYRTQKARGLDAGWSLSSNAGYGYSVAPHDGVMPHVAPAVLANLTFPKFARPCPVTPRHGFVDSRSVKDIHELEKLFELTLAHDPKGELIIMDRLTGLYSAVMTATGVAWGHSNDGVTSGKGNSIVIPTPAGRFDQMFLPVLGKECDADEGVYAELVEHNGNVCVVQMRLGPKQPDSRIKRHVVGLSTKIVAILKPESDDLIAWDRFLKRPRSQGRYLVWLPGHTMASHFAVQAIANGYNVSVEDVCPVDMQKGGILKPDTSVVTALNDEDYVMLGDMFEREKSMRFWDYPRDVMLSVGILHSLPYWDNQPHLLALRARGVVIAARYGLAACLGESRHKLRLNEGGGTAKVPWEKLMGQDPNSDEFRPSRSYVFVRSFGMPWELGQELAMAASLDMRLGDQPPVMEHLAKGGKLGDFSASFMGQRWEWAALRVHDLFAAIDRFCKTRNLDNWNVVLGHYNEIINAAHNGGYLLNKWCSPSLIDNAASAPSLVFGFRNVMNLVFGDHANDEPRVAWLPLSKMPAGDKGDNYLKTENGTLIPRVLLAKLQAEGVMYSIAETCLCDICMRPRWKTIGLAAISNGTPCYVPDDIISKMPKLGCDDSITAKAMYAEVMEPVEKTDPPGDDDYEDIVSCAECGSILDMGECIDPGCPNCPDYEAPPDETKELIEVVKPAAKYEDIEEDKPNGDEVPKV